MTPNLFSFYARTESGLKVGLFWTVKEAGYRTEAPIKIGVHTEFYCHPCAGKLARNKKNGQDI